MGTPEYAAVSLRRLLAGPHRVCAVVTRPDRPRGRGQRVEPGPVKALARSAGIEVLEPVSPREPGFVERLRALDVDLGVVIAYGRILPRAVLDLPRLGCINAHASLLPKLRGAAPIERAILAGMTESGVTIMQMNEGLDEGDILLARALAIPDAMTGSQLRGELAELSATLLVEALDRLAEGGAAALPRRPQDHAEATFAPPLRKSEAALHFDADCRACWLQVRAFAPRPGAFAFDGAIRVKILAARVVATGERAAPGTVLGTSETGLLVACGSGALEVVTVQPEGKRAMPALEYERGMRASSSQRRVLRDGE